MLHVYLLWIAILDRLNAIHRWLWAGVHGCIAHPLLFLTGDSALARQLHDLAHVCAWPGRALPPAPGKADRIERALFRIGRGRQEQDARWGARSFPSAGLGMGTPAVKAECARLQAACDLAMAERRCTFADVLLEEVAELLATTTSKEALAEAVQVGAVIVKLIEYLDDADSLECRPLRVYLACNWPLWPLAEELARGLTEAGHEVVSTWHAFAATGKPEGNKTARSRVNLKDLRTADVLLAWTATGEPRATLGEIGYGLAFGKPTLWVQDSDGRGGNLFEHEPAVQVLRLDDAEAKGTVLSVFQVFAARVRKAAKQ